jgi:hypothetical protein
LQRAVCPGQLALLLPHDLLRSLLLAKQAHLGVDKKLLPEYDFKYSLEGNSNRR